MYLGLLLSICLMNSIVFCTDANKFELYDTSSSSTQNSSIVSTSTQTISLSSLETPSEYRSSNTTYRPRYPDTFSPGAITGVAIGSFLFIFVISMSSYYIRRQRIYYLPYYHDYHPV